MDMTLLLTPVIDGVGNLIGEILIGIALGAVELARRIYRNSRRIAQLEEETEIGSDPTRLEKHERAQAENERHIRELKQYFTGDPADPNNPGILQELHDIKEALDSEHND